MQHGACTTVVEAMETFPGDQRIAHVGLSALRNLSIPGIFYNCSVIVVNLSLSLHSKTQVTSSRLWSTTVGSETSLYNEPTNPI
jgi:hypothetical protein